VNDNATHRTVYVIAGPTAVGKTAIAIALAQQLYTAIVSADSRQCYQQMNIGTAKPTPEELQQVKHYFIDTFPITNALTATDYEELALGYLDEIFTNSNTAVVCGGTGLYIKALCEGLDNMPDVDEQIAYNLNITYRKEGLAWLWYFIDVQLDIKAPSPNTKIIFFIFFNY
jgi:tRNA dimethylallyltransferase